MAIAVLDRNRKGKETSEDTTWPSNGTATMALDAGCLLAILAVVLFFAAGWYFAVKESQSFIGSETIRSVWGWVSPGPPSLDREYLEAEMLQQINAHRERSGLQALRSDDRLAAIALAHSRDMAENGYYPDDHLNLLGQNPTERARKAGYECIKPTSIGVAEKRRTRLSLRWLSGTSVVLAVANWPRV